MAGFLCVYGDKDELFFKSMPLPENRSSAVDTINGCTWIL